MTDRQGLSGRELSRRDLLKLGAAAGGAALLGARAATASAALERATAESGRLQVLDWAGYEVKDLWLPYLEKYPGQKPKFTFMTNEANALAKMHAGFEPDVVRPYVGYVRDFAESGFVQPWDTKLIPNLKQLNPTMVRAGRYEGKQYGIPQDWGFDAILYRADKVTPKERSWSLLFDERYGGKIAWFDDLNQLVWAGYYLGFKRPYDQTDAELKKSQALLESKKHLVRMFWSSETDMQNAFASGDIWIAFAWPADWVAMKSKGLKVVYMHPREGALSWIGMLMLGKDSPRPEHAHAFVDAWSSARTGRWLEDNYGYGHANLRARPKSSDLLRALRLADPNAVKEPNAHIDRHIPRRRLYAKLWEEVKAA
ncbi:MAG TPA: extracellular solute-binding protein [Gaiellaceae bacterium]|nr:extracellular solute-binding protein [Gaiellaceae bacterium]